MSAGGPEENISIVENASAPRKKRRTLACKICRRQKLRCDRAVPVCGRCSAIGSLNSCIYEDAVPNSDQQRSSTPANFTDGGGTCSTENGLHSVTTPHPSRSTSRVKPAQERPVVPGPAATTRYVISPDPVSHIEETPRSSPETLENRQPSVLWRPQPQIISLSRGTHQMTREKETPLQAYAEPMIFRGRHFATEYFGATHPISFIARFPELQNFMVEAISQDTSLAQVQRSLKSLQLQWKHAKPPLVDIGLIDLTHLLRLLPGRQAADKLINIYWTTFETIYRILYRPRFWADYEALWMRPMGASADFVVIVLLVMASVSCIAQQDRLRYMGDSSSSREAAIAWIEVCEFWLSLQSRKNISVSYWQSHCLLLLAKLSHTVKKKRSWTSAGALMRLAMSAGFHRDPDFLRWPMSRLEKELRRRLWATMLELELQVSIDRGMPSSACNVLSDCAQVLNINDEDLNAKASESQLLPSKFYTASSFLHFSKESFRLRSSLNALINTSEPQLTQADVFGYDEQLMNSLDQVASFNSSSRTTTNNNVSELPCVLLDIQLRQFLLLLHAPFAIRPEASARYSSSRLACLNAAVAIMDQYNRLPIIDRNALSLVRHDTLRSALVTCHVIEASRNLSSEKLLTKLGDSLHDQLDAALEQLAENITLLGTGYTHYWYLSAAYGLLKTGVPGTSVQVEQRIAVDRVIRQYYKVLASQEDATVPTTTRRYRQLYGLDSVKSAIRNQPEDTTHPNVTTSNISLAQIPFFLDPPDPQLEEFFFGDPAAWTFENVW